MNQSNYDMNGVPTRMPGVKAHHNRDMVQQGYYEVPDGNEVNMSNVRNIVDQIHVNPGYPNSFVIKREKVPDPSRKKPMPKAEQLKRDSLDHIRKTGSVAVNRGPTQAQRAANTPQRVDEAQRITPIGRPTAKSEQQPLAGDLSGVVDESEVGLAQKGVPIFRSMGRKTDQKAVSPPVANFTTHKVAFVYNVTSEDEDVEVFTAEYPYHNVEKFGDDTLAIVINTSDANYKPWYPQESENPVAVTCPTLIPDMYFLVDTSTLVRKTLGIYELLLYKIREESPFQQ